jgi:hypothetical protein
MHANDWPISSSLPRIYEAQRLRAAARRQPPVLDREQPVRGDIDTTEPMPWLREATPETGARSQLGSTQTDEWIPRSFNTSRARVTRLRRVAAYFPPHWPTDREHGESLYRCGRPHPRDQLSQCVADRTGYPVPATTRGCLRPGSSANFGGVISRTRTSHGHCRGTMYMSSRSTTRPSPHAAGSSRTGSARWRRRGVPHARRRAWPGSPIGTGRRKYSRGFAASTPTPAVDPLPELPTSQPRGYGIIDGAYGASFHLCPSCDRCSQGCRRNR